MNDKLKNTMMNGELRIENEKDNSQLTIHDSQFKKTEIGVIPNAWEVRKLEDVSYVIMGQSPIGSSYNKIGDGYALINGPTEFTKRCPIKIQWTSSPTKFCKNGDVLICVRGSSTGRINISNDEYCIGRGVAAIRAKERTNHSYLEFQINNAVKNILSLTAGSTFPNIDGKTLKQISIPLPPLPEQKAIAEVLSDTDNLIQALEKRIAKKRLIKQGAMQKLLTPKKDWGMKKLGEICDVRDGTHESPKYLDDGIKFITSKNIINGRLDFSDLKYISEKDAIEIGKRSKVDQGDILMSMIGTIGNAVLIDFEPDFSIKNVALFKPFIKYVNPLFLIQTLYSQNYQGYIESKLDGGIQKFISLGVLRDLDVPLPPTNEEQTRIATILSDMDSEIETLEKKLAKYKQLKQGLMQELLTGKTRLIVNYK